MRHHSRRIFLVLTLVAAAALQFQGPSAFAQAPLTVLRVGADPDYRPTSFIDASGKTVGVDVDFATALAAKLGIPLEYIGVAWDGIIPALQAKKIDAITSMVITDKRKEVVAFSQPLFTQTITLVVRADRPDFNPGRENLATIKVGVQINTAAAAALEKIGGVKPTTYNNAPDEYNDLMLGRIDTVAIESFGGLYTAEAVYPGKLRVTGISLSDTPQNIGIAMRKEDTDLLAAVNTAIDEMKTNGTLGTIAKKWYGSADVVAK